MEEDPEHMSREQGEGMMLGTGAGRVLEMQLELNAGCPVGSCFLKPRFSSPVLLSLFALHDYDQNGQLDGLELLSMLTAALAPEAVHFPINPVSAAGNLERLAPRCFGPFGRLLVRRKLRACVVGTRLLESGWVPENIYGNCFHR